MRKVWVGWYIKCGCVGDHILSLKVFGLWSKKNGYAFCFCRFHIDGEAVVGEVLFDNGHIGLRGANEGVVVGGVDEKDNVIDP